MLVRVKPPVGELNEVLDLVKKTENNPLSKAGCDYFATREQNPRCGFCLRCLWPPIWNNGQPIVQCLKREIGASVFLLH